ncbi:hypothetical protein [Mesorhizobium sp. M0037]|uniref:hypothetical protein n=1 Tax=unclassified Mesorhizobium TaxID=325217 RepID=UPI00333597C3
MADNPFKPVSNFMVGNRRATVEDYDNWIQNSADDLARLMVERVKFMHPNVDIGDEAYNCAIRSIVLNLMPAQGGKQ